MLTCLEYTYIYTHTHISSSYFVSLTYITTSMFYIVKHKPLLMFLSLKFLGCSCTFGFPDELQNQKTLMGFKIPLKKL